MTLHRAGDDPLHVDAFRIDPVDTTGAGDAFCGALAGALAEGTALADAATIAAAAGSLAVRSPGASASCAGREEILSFLEP